MLRPPSIQKNYDEFWSGDPAFIQPASDATEKDIEAHAERVRIARETGGWASLLVGDAQPSKFVMRPLPGHVWRVLLDKYLSGAIGPAQFKALLFRAALRAVENLDDLKVEFVNVFGVNGFADNEVPDALDSLDVSIVAELGDEVQRRSKTIHPKS